MNLRKYFLIISIFFTCNLYPQKNLKEENSRTARAIKQIKGTKNCIGPVSQKIYSFINKNLTTNTVTSSLFVYRGIKELIDFLSFDKKFFFEYLNNFEKFNYKKLPVHTEKLIHKLCLDADLDIKNMAFLESDEIYSGATTGGVKKNIIFCSSEFNEYDLEKQKYVIGHEISHIKHRDEFYRCIALISIPIITNILLKLSKHLFLKFSNNPKVKNYPKIESFFQKIKEITNTKSDDPAAEIICSFCFHYFLFGLIYYLTARSQEKRCDLESVKLFNSSANAAWKHYQKYADERRVLNKQYIPKTSFKKLFILVINEYCKLFKRIIKVDLPEHPSVATRIKYLKALDLEQG